MLLLKQNLPENTRHALLSSSFSTPFLSFSPCVLPLPPDGFFSVELNCVPCLYMLHTRVQEKLGVGFRILGSRWPFAGVGT